MFFFPFFLFLNYIYRCQYSIFRSFVQFYGARFSVAPHILKFEPMSTVLTTVGTLSNLKFHYTYPVKNEEFLFSNRFNKEYIEKSRHIPSIKSRGSALFVFEILQDHSVNKKILRDYTENNLVTSTYIEMKCKMMFPNSIVPRYGFLQLVKKGEQDLICLKDRNYFVSVRGNSISHCVIDEVATNNLLYTDSNVMQFYSQAQHTSKHANTLEQFAYDFFVKDLMPFACIAQKLSCIKIGLQLDTQKQKYYTEETDFHVGDLFVKTEIGLMATHTRYAENRKRKLVDSKQDALITEIANETEHAYEDVLDTSKYIDRDDFSVFDGL